MIFIGALHVIITTSISAYWSNRDSTGHRYGKLRPRWLVAFPQTPPVGVQILWRSIANHRNMNRGWSTAAIEQETAMIDYELDKENSIVLVRPKSALQADDFTKLASAVDPQIEATGDLAGVIIEASGFPGWDSFGALVHHLRFVRDHHKHVKKIAVVTDSALGDFAERLASHFVSAEIRHFPEGQADKARQWILSGA